VTSLEVEPGSPDRAVVGESFHGFGTTIGIWTTEPVLLAHLGPWLKGWVERVEAACSRFSPTSDLSRANAAAGTPVVVSQDLLSAFQAAAGMAEITDGLYDPAVGTAVIEAGYDRTFEAVAAEGPGPRGPGQRGGAWRQVEVDAQASTITVPPGYRLDLGGSAKGWAVDVALEGLRTSLLTDNPDAGICISAGGDIAVAGTGPAGGWPVIISERLDRSIATSEGYIRLARGAIATSGATARRWSDGRTPGHHIIDPRTGLPGSSRWALVSIFADTCLVADTVATAVWLLDAEAPEWIDSWGLGARLVDLDGNETRVGDLGSWLDLEAA
jgi:thiamine biosynthesis lipoprotein